MHQGYRSVAYVRYNWYKDHVWGKSPLEYLCSFPGKGICLPPPVLAVSAITPHQLLLLLLTCLFTFSQVSL